MDRFKKFLKQAIHEQAVRVKLQAGSSCELLLSSGARYIDDGIPLDDAYLNELFAVLFPNDGESIRTKPMVKGALSVPNVGRIPMIAQPGSPACLRLYLPPEGARLFENDWKRLSSIGSPIIVDPRLSQGTNTPPEGELSPRDEAQGDDPPGIKPIETGFIPSILTGSSTMSPDLAVKPSWSKGESVDSGAAPKPALPAFGAPLQEEEGASSWEPPPEAPEASSIPLAPVARSSQFAVSSVENGPPSPAPEGGEAEMVPGLGSPSIELAPRGHQGSHTIATLLASVIDAGASDLHLTVGEVPYLRIDGKMTRMEREDVSSEAMEAYLSQLTASGQRGDWTSAQSFDFVYDAADLGRFRVWISKDYRGVRATMRHIPRDLPTVERLELPESLVRLTTLRRGLVLVTGAMGSGRSTTIAALVDRINQTRSSHIVILEESLEFLYKTNQALIHQRDVRAEGISMVQALREVQREDPDIVVLGEMRDPEAALLAMEIAEAGCLVIGVMANPSVAGTIESLIEQASDQRQGYVRSRLASTLKAVVAQTLVPKKEGGRALALEILVVSDSTATMMRDGKLSLLSSHIQSQKGEGNQSLTEALLRLVKEGVVDADEALNHAVDRFSLAEALRRAHLSSDASHGRVNQKSA